MLVGDVAQEMRHAGELSRFVDHWDRNSLDEEPHPVLAHLPAVTRGAARTHGQLDGTLGLLAVDVILRAEQVERLPDCFVRRVAKDGLRTVIPRADATLRIRHEDGVVGDVLDQRAVAPFSFAYDLLCLFLAIEILAHLVLAFARAKRGTHQGDERGGADWTLDHAYVSEASYQLRQGSTLASVARQHDDRDVRPHRLRGHTSQQFIRIREQTLFGDDQCAGTGFMQCTQMAHVRAHAAVDLVGGEQLGHRHRIRGGSREYEYAALVRRCPEVLCELTTHFGG